MTTPNISRDRALGRGVNAVIPEPGAPQTPAARARAALAAVQTSEVPNAVLDAVAGLLLELAPQAQDEDTRQAAEEAAAYLRATLT
ncbi:hypothetical protein [Streptomyces sp. NPDC053048]|uniref:hypothetical protein n=1 Tax=Streptomyces sp. NPDC053048 TaxID=3365694 RepID=UPI0037CFD68F